MNTQWLEPGFFLGSFVIVVVLVRDFCRGVMSLWPYRRLIPLPARGDEWGVVLVAHGPAMVPSILGILLADTTTVPVPSRRELNLKRVDVFLTLGGSGSYKF